MPGSAQSLNQTSLAQAAAGGMPGERPDFRTVDPSNDTFGQSYTGHLVPEAQDIACAAHDAFLSWRRTPLDRRGELMREAAAMLRRRQQDFAELMTAEMGKTRKEGLAEIEKCAFNCEHFAENARLCLARESVNMGAPKAFVTYNPLGVVLAVMPRNFPF
jgi:succinate-semialdehyde dehydrogenase/glutarate-semialdehyde dehydrogenase